ARLGLAEESGLPVAAVAGVKAAHLGGVFGKAPINDTSDSASAAIRALARAVETRQAGLVLATEQSVATAAALHLGDTPATVVRHEVLSGELPDSGVASGVGI